METYDVYLVVDDRARSGQYAITNWATVVVRERQQAEEYGRYIARRIAAQHQSKYFDVSATIPNSFVVRQRDV